MRTLFYIIVFSFFYQCVSQSKYLEVKNEAECWEEEFLKSQDNLQKVKDSLNDSQFLVTRYEEIRYNGAYKLYIDSLKIHDTIDELFVTSDVRPKFPGGNYAMTQYFNKHMEYPKEAKARGIEGKVSVKFIIKKNGRVYNPKITSGIGGGCDESVLEAVSNMPAWIPGEISGRKVNVLYFLELSFFL